LGSRPCRHQCNRKLLSPDRPKKPGAKNRQIIGHPDAAERCASLDSPIGTRNSSKSPPRLISTGPCPGSRPRPITPPPTSLPTTLPPLSAAEFGTALCIRSFFHLSGNSPTFWRNYRLRLKRLNAPVRPKARKKARVVAGLTYFEVAWFPESRPTSAHCVKNASTIATPVAPFFPRTSVV
jgi:hypothetical protein